MVKFINFSVHRRLRIINKKRCKAFDVRCVSNAIKPVLEKPSQISNPRGSRFQCNILQRISVCQRNIMPDTRANDTRKWRIVKNVAWRVKGKKDEQAALKFHVTVGTNYSMSSESNDESAYAKFHAFLSHCRNAKTISDAYARSSTRSSSFRPHPCRRMSQLLFRLFNTRENTILILYPPRRSTSPRPRTILVVPRPKQLLREQTRE